MISEFPKVSNFSRLILELNRFIGYQRHVLSYSVWLSYDHYIREFETFSCLKLIYGLQQYGLMFGSSDLNHLDMSSS